jgi:hypothetical protein
LHIIFPNEPTDHLHIPMNEQTNHAASIDRLAAGELDDAVRRDLFAWLDREPSRWRRCALALLEARELEEALGAWHAETPTPAAPLTPARTAPIARASTLFTLAASILVAFSLGVLARGFFAAPAPAIVAAEGSADDRTQPRTDKREPLDALPKGPQPESDQRPTAVALAPASARQSDLIPPYIRSQLERRGYQVSSRSARLPVVLPDGRRTMVPVDELQLNYVGQRTY